METAKRRAGEVCFQEEARILPAADAIVRRWLPEAGLKRVTSSAAGRADSVSWPAPREARSQNLVVNHPSRLMIVSKLTDLFAIVNIHLTLRAVGRTIAGYIKRVEREWTRPQKEKT